MEQQEVRFSREDFVHTADASGAETPPRFLGSLKGLALFAGATFLAAAAGGLVTSRRRNKAWYRALSKPAFTPPDRVFSLVWPVLYSLSAWSAWRVAKAPAGPTRNVALAFWTTQLAANAAWSPLFFGSHRPRLALADLLANYASLGAYAWTAQKVDRPAAWLVSPYLGWLTFAGALNSSIVTRNGNGFRGLVVRALA